MTEPHEAPGIPTLERFRVDPDAVAQRLGDEIVLVQLRTDRVLVLNPTAARAWELLCAGHDQLGIQRRLLQEFDVPASQLADELDRLMRSLQDEQLITRDTDR